MRKALILIVALLLLPLSYADVYMKIVGAATYNNKSVGVPADLYVYVRSGSGHVFVDTMPLTKVDTQASARLARDVACNLLDKDCSKYDFYYIIRSNYSMIGGPSAGAAMTIATMAELNGVEVNKNVAITGLINPDGSIGHVGAILEKASAAKEAGIDLLLIPYGEGILKTENGTMDVIKKAKSDYNLQVVEVKDVFEAYAYLTGYNIVREKVSDEEITSEKYTEVMKSLSEDLISDAQNKRSEVERYFNTSTIPLDKIDVIKTYLSDAKKYLDTADDLRESGEYYSAASYAVRSLINSYLAENYIDYYTKGKEAVKSKIDNLGKDIDGFYDLYLKNKKIDSLYDIEVFAVTIDRISESQETYNKSLMYYEKGDMDSAIYYLSYGQVRKNTAYAWFTLINEFKGEKNYVFKEEEFRDLALERIEEARNIIIYAQTLSSNYFLDEAKDHLSSAEKSYNDGNYIFAIFEASKARANANLAITVLSMDNNQTTDALYSFMEDDAKRSIKSAEERGLIPILALSYLEYSKSLKSEDLPSSLIFLSYSKEMSVISVDLAKAVAGEDLIPSPKIKSENYYQSLLEMSYHQQLIYEIIIFVTGVLGGIAIVFMFRK